MVLEPTTGESAAAPGDWDHSVSDIHIDQESLRSPSACRMDIVSGNDDEDTSGSTKGRRSLSDLLRLHAEKGKDLKLSEEDEQRLSEELGKWINSDSSPYEPDDDFFSRPSRDDSSLTMSSVNKHTGLNGRPRGQSESILAAVVSGGSRPGSAAGEAKT